MSPVRYVHEAGRSCEAHLAANLSGKLRLPQRANNLFNMGYDPELNVSPMLEPHIALLMGILRWMIKLGKIDMITKVYYCHHIWHYQGRCI